MADEKDEEYQIDDSALAGAPEESEHEADRHESTAEQPTVVRDSQLPADVPVVYQRVLAVVGMILLVFAMYKIIMWIVSFGKHQPVTTMQTISQPVAQPITPPVTTVTQPPPKQADNGLDVDAVNAKFTELASTQQETQSNLQNINNQVNSVESQLQSINEKMNALTGLVQNLNAQLEAEKAKQQLLAVKAAKPVKRKPPLRHVVKPAFVKYFLQAAIPGRAWLIQENGTGTITVSIGSRVPGYGVVGQIDANAGQVRMSSGKIITFDRNDS